MALLYCLLKSYQEFGIDEDNKTIIHHKVAARVVCVFNKQVAQVAARAEQHQQQHLQQQQQFLQQQAASGAPSPLTTVTGAGSGSGIISGAGGPQNFPFAAAQRGAQLAQQGLGGMGGV
jgi:tetrahydromethanopterin S-methyltransferase subunit H